MNDIQIVTMTPAKFIKWAETVKRENLIFDDIYNRIRVNSKIWCCDTSRIYVPSKGVITCMCSFVDDEETPIESFTFSLSGYCLSITRTFDVV